MTTGVEDPVLSYSRSLGGLLLAARLWRAGVPSRLPSALLSVLVGFLVFAPGAGAIILKPIELTPENAEAHGFSMSVRYEIPSCAIQFEKFPSVLEKGRQIALQIGDEDSFVAGCPLRPFESGGKVYPIYNFRLSKNRLSDSVIWITKDPAYYSDQGYWLNLGKWLLPAGKKP